MEACILSTEELQSEATALNKPYTCTCNKSLIHSPEAGLWQCLAWEVDCKQNKQTKRPDLELDDALLGEAQVHPLRVLQVEGTLVQLGHWVVCVHQGRLLVHFANDLGDTATATATG